MKSAVNLLSNWTAMTCTKDEQTLQIIVNAFYEQNCAMVIGTYRMTDVNMNEIVPGVIDHKEWTPHNGRNNALRINGLRAPRAFFFELKDVTIGINFHWERKEVQKFKGELKIIVEGEQLTAINVISIEEYLTSVISSEMSATASLELLKAHAVISRSWLLNK